MLEECAQCAGETDLPLHRLHLRLDARDLAQSDTMDRIGGKVGGRAAACQIGIELVAARHRRQADAVARLGHVVVGDEGPQPGQRRADLLRVGRDISGLQPRPLGRRDRCREVLYGFDEAARRALLRKHRVELLDDVDHHQLGLGDAARHTLAHPRDRAVDVGDEAVDPAKPVIVILNCLERCRAVAAADLRKGGMDASEMIDRADCGQGEQIGLEAAQIVRSLPLEHVVGNAFGRGQPGAIDPLQRRQVGRRRGAFGGVVGIADPVAELTRVAHVAAIHGAQRITPQVALVARRKQRRQRLRRRLGSGGCGGGGRLRPANRRDGQHRQGDRPDHHPTLHRHPFDHASKIGIHLLIFATVGRQGFAG